MELFRNMQADFHLVEIPTINEIHIWNNRWGEAHQVASMLDQFLAYKDIISRDIYYETSILPCLGSDHCPIQLEEDLKQGHRNQPLRFESFWLRDFAFLDKVKDWLNSSLEYGRMSCTHSSFA